jgi:hypothetical protein
MASIPGDLLGRNHEAAGANQRTFRSPLWILDATMEPRD